MLTRRGLHTVCCIVLIAAVQGEGVATEGEEAAPGKVFKAAPAADPVPQNGTTNGEGNGKFYIKIGGSSSLASLQSSSDGTGNGNTGDGSGNNNGNRATGNGNGNGKSRLAAWLYDNLSDSALLYFGVLPYRLYCQMSAVGKASTDGFW
ncbi:hypothetical protein COCOBI_04-3340 [Coccomyxa sp. Obi]|nr:hypothetical protein COCOBI_04-3340 [Coccomyxa sp. Obi]